MLTARFIDVGQGNMVLLHLANGSTMLYDCHVTNENASRVLALLGDALPNRRIDVFVNSHREADHMRGVKRVHEAFPISVIWDGSVPGGDTRSPEYLDYMELRRTIPCATVGRRQQAWFGTTRVRILSGKNHELPDDPNVQSIVLKIENWYGGQVANSLMLTGDSNAQTWKQFIIPEYGADVASTILVGGHHGAEDFVSDPGGNLYIMHLVTIRPRVTVVSVGDNSYGHPTPLALRAYNAFSAGGDWVLGGPSDLKVLRTDLHGSMRLQLYDNGSWVLNWDGPSPRTEGDSIAALVRLALQGMSHPSPLPGLSTLSHLAAPLPPALPLFPQPTGLADLARAVADALNPPALTGLSEFELGDIIRVATTRPRLLFTPTLWPTYSSGCRRAPCPGR